MLLYWINQNLNSSIEWKLWANVKILWVAEGAQNVQCVLCLGQGCSKSSFRRCSQLEKFTIHYISRHLCPGTLSMYYLKRPENKQGCECSDDVANKLGPNWIQMAISQKNPINIHPFHPQSSIFIHLILKFKHFYRLGDMGPSATLYQVHVGPNKFGGVRP